MTSLAWRAFLIFCTTDKYFNAMEFLMYAVRWPCMPTANYGELLLLLTAFCIYPSDTASSAHRATQRLDHYQTHIPVRFSMRWEQPLLQQRLLLLSAVVLLLMAAAPSTHAQEAAAASSPEATPAASPAANNTAVVLNSTAPVAATSPSPSPSPGPVDNGTTLTLSTVDQPVPPFSALRSCLPFNILLASAQVGVPYVDWLMF
jgi:hypothetical protein